MKKIFIQQDLRFNRPIYYYVVLNTPYCKKVKKGDFITKRVNLKYKTEQGWEKCKDYCLLRVNDVVENIIYCDIVKGRY